MEFVPFGRARCSPAEVLETFAEQSADLVENRSPQALTPPLHEALRAAWLSVQFRVKALFSSKSPRFSAETLHRRNQKRLDFKRATDGDVHDVNLQYGISFFAK